MIKSIRNLLIHPKIKNLDVNSSEIVSVSREILDAKKMFKQVISEFYSICNNSDLKYFNQKGDKLEIGAGVSFIKDLYPNVITSDIKKTTHLDMVVDALNMQLENNSMSAIYGINCFHHLPDPDLFFKELNRVLVKGGGCILIDPYHGPTSSFIYKRLTPDEIFDKNQEKWADPQNMVMKGANQALSYIVFLRDIKKFKKMHPNLELVLQKPLNNYLRYLISGGLNFKQLLPNFMIPLIKLFEFFLTPINHFFALHQVIIIRKK